MLDAQNQTEYYATKNDFVESLQRLTQLEITALVRCLLEIENIRKVGYGEVTIRFRGNKIFVSAQTEQMIKEPTE